ncbi:Mobile element protein [Candidatus Enterovibrio altilux]|uniref:Mobile element protein n=1 Tax=Candidatus Enterovibrio altilux TaxID=1927128 RepID=A0A291B7L2_9GAMM|nr:Mobile element protein [Candidatus Enterovibrio luxaltus]
MTDGEVPPNLLKQIRRKINTISTNDADDTKQCYETIHIQRAVPLISPRKGATF